jgi:hypothetical protein
VKERPIESIFEVLFEPLFEVTAEIIFTFGWEGLPDSMRKKQNTNPVFAGLGYSIVGALAGGVSLLIFPRRLLPAGDVKGVTFQKWTFDSMYAMGEMFAYPHHAAHGTMGDSAWTPKYTVHSIDEGQGKKNPYLWEVKSW